jgi:hemerythrin-like domain-containing protein
MAHPFIQHLLEDHEKQRSLAAQLKATKEPKVRSDLREELSEEVLPHMAGEEASIFAYMTASGDEEAREHALEAVQEHHVGRLVLQEIMDLSLESDVFSAKAAVLGEINEHHMQEEESEHFPWLEAHASKEKLDELFEEYEAAEKAEKRG